MMKSSKTKRGIFFGLLCAAMVFAPLAASAGETITINSNIARDVYGNGDETADGDLPLQDRNGNTVEIQSAIDVVGSVYGGFFDDTTGSESVSGNSVTINGGQVGVDVYGGYIDFTSGATGASAEGNHVTLNIGGVGGNIYGGYSTTGATGPARTSGNTVTINGGTAGGYIYGGYSDGNGNSASSRNNSLTVTGGTINTDKIYGGFAQSFGTGLSADASGNSVVLSGGDIKDYLLVLGGYGWASGHNGTGAATGNSVTVGGSLTLSGAGALSVKGGDSFSADSFFGADNFTGNTFNKNSDVLVDSASFFENVNFGYSGDANIKVLDTDPGGSANYTVNIDTGSNSVVFNGIIWSGNIDKKGSGELTLTDATYLGAVTLSEGTLKNGAGDTITVTVNGVPRQLAPGESATNNAGGGDVTNEGGGSGGGCDAGVGVFALALLPLAYAGMKRREK